MLALAGAVSDGRIPDAEVVLVVSDQANAAGLRHAVEHDIKTLVIERGGRSREEHDRLVVQALQEHAVELVCLAGYMRVLSSYFIDSYRNRILNIHPSLLPSFPGLAAQQQALDHGVKWTGCTVHFVDETLDGGPIIVQSIVPIFDDDTEDTLSARILQEEHKLYPEAVALVVTGKYELINRRVKVELATHSGPV